MHFLYLVPVPVPVPISGFLLLLASLGCLSDDWVLTRF